MIIEATGSLGSFDVGEPTEIIGGKWFELTAYDNDGPNIFEC